ncbi:hypothetical protein FNH13_08350 [Ornithinimicrobium ciconiae]|uniref:HNH endonuclease n=1 Tax=Ornithinimicrobium ciconiae TaxID=2594265 RepID=A0A516G9Z6_9MICO|nr:hypothetical protein [Ornithinimicrobium ciconiae]QDO88351.1 hypothetical protein FNH13_08350 [Ornithinimicrobium ciconiae]
MSLRPCLDCGVPTEADRCPEHTTYRSHDLPPSARGYDAAWSRLSRRARRLQPFCSVPGCADTDLTVDHTPEAWARHDIGLEVRLEDVQVLCRSHNSQKGAAR